LRDTSDGQYLQKDFEFQDVGKLEVHDLIDSNMTGILNPSGDAGMQNFGEDAA
jgi:hypothetical protein